LDWDNLIINGKVTDHIVNGIDRQSCEDVAFLRNSFLTGQIEEDDIKVFILDKVYDSIEKYIKLDLKEEISGVFVGQSIEKEDDLILVINGLIEARHTAHVNGVLEYTEDTWEAIYTEKQKFFNEKEIVGWFYVCPGYGTFLSYNDNFLKNNFSDFKWNLAYIIDPVEKNTSVFQRVNLELRNISGYLVYSKTKSLSKETYSEKEYIMDDDINNDDINDDNLKTKDFNDEVIENLIYDEDKKENIQVGKDMSIRLRTTPNTFINILSLVLIVVVIIMSFNLIMLNGKVKELSQSVPDETTESINDNLNIKIGELETRITLLEKELEDSINEVDSQTNNQQSSSQTVPDTTSNDDSQFTKYVVEKGDTLWSISKAFYGDGSKYYKIVQANGGNENITAGQTLLIPKL
jgi:LysM repeat protein